MRRLCCLMNQFRQELFKQGGHNVLRMCTSSACAASTVETQSAGRKRHVTQGLYTKAHPNEPNDVHDPIDIGVTIGHLQDRPSHLKPMALWMSHCYTCMQQVARVCMFTNGTGILPSNQAIIGRCCSLCMRSARRILHPGVSEVCLRMFKNILQQLPCSLANRRIAASQCNHL